MPGQIMGLSTLPTLPMLPTKIRELPTTRGRHHPSGEIFYTNANLPGPDTKLILGFHVTSQAFPNMVVRHICAPQSVKFMIIVGQMCSFCIFWAVL